VPQGQAIQKAPVEQQHLDRVRAQVGEALAQ